MTLKTVILPQLALAQELARECVSLGALGALAGPPGTGKTTALQHIEATYGNSGLAGSCVYLRAYRAEGGGRAIRDLLESLGVRGSTMPINLSLQFLIAMALKELQQREVSLIVVDEADAWGPEALRGFVSLYDAACQRGKPYGAILAGTSDMVRWLESFASALSRTLRCEEFRDLDSQTSDILTSGESG